MKLTRASSYALQALAYMASQKTESTIASHIIAKARHIPDRFLLKVLKPLVEHRVLESVKGPNGGYRLARPAHEISILEVIEAIDYNGRALRGQVPIDIHDEQDAGLKERLESICNQAAEQVRKSLDKVKLSDLVKR